MSAWRRQRRARRREHRGAPARIGADPIGSRRCPRVVGYRLLRRSITGLADPVLILTGPPGAGKTTTARLLATESERSVHLEADWFFRVVNAGYVEPSKPESHEQNVTVMRVVAAAAAGYADGGYFTIIDGIISPDWFLAPLRASLNAAGHRVAYAVLRPPLATCIARVSERESGLRADVVEQLWREFADMGQLERHVIENDVSGAAAAARELQQRLQDGRLHV